jgi:hypothetical protein
MFLELWRQGVVAPLALVLENVPDVERGSHITIPLHVA